MRARTLARFNRDMNKTLDLAVLFCVAGLGLVTAKHIQIALSGETGLSPRQIDVSLQRLVSLKFLACYPNLPSVVSSYADRDPDLISEEDGVDMPYKTGRRDLIYSITLAHRRDAGLVQFLKSKTIAPSIREEAAEARHTSVRFAREVKRLGREHEAREPAEGESRGDYDRTTQNLPRVNVDTGEIESPWAGLRERLLCALTDRGQH